MASLVVRCRTNAVRLKEYDYSLLRCWSVGGLSEADDVLDWIASAASETPPTRVLPLQGCCPQEGITEASLSEKRLLPLP